MMVGRFLLFVRGDIDSGVVIRGGARSLLGDTYLDFSAWFPMK
jgi:hypothetical protein